MSFALAKCVRNLGEFMALTGWPMRGPDLVHAKLVRWWMSPEALPFLELTSEKQLEVSESDARIMLEEHSLKLPDISPFIASFCPEGTSAEANQILAFVEETFEKQSLEDIRDAVQMVAQGRGGVRRHVESFAQECSRRIGKACPLAQEAALQLIRRAKEVVSQDKAGLMSSLRLELQVQQWLLSEKDTVARLHAYCLADMSSKYGSLGLLHPSAPPSFGHKGKRWGVSSWEAQEARETVQKQIERFDRLAETEVVFAVSERSDISLSTHPKLRQYHPDFDPKTGLDHDPVWMEQEVRRWNPRAFAAERQDKIRGLLGEDLDPADYGQARFTRVDP